MLKEKIYRLILYPVVWLVRFLIALRYRVKVKGWEHLTSHHFKGAGGILFLPNHPAEIDPVILESLLWSRFHPRPLVVEHFYHLKGFKILMDMVGALPLPFMENQANKWRAQKVEKQFGCIISALKNKDNFLIYPSGGLKKTEAELIGGASFVHKLVQAVPEAHIVLVRTSGLWGSQFSKALTGSSPDFGKVLLHCLKILLKNGLFFTPKRDVLVEFELPSSDFPVKGTRLEFNKALENWYNRSPDPLTLVSLAFWKRAVPEVHLIERKRATAQSGSVTIKIQQEVFAHLASLSGRSPTQVEAGMHLSHDLGLDSLDVMQVTAFLDERYGVNNLFLGELQTVEDVLQCAAGHRQDQENDSSSHTQSRFVWPEEKRRGLPEMPEGETIQEVFLQSAMRHGSLTATLDNLSGPLSYSKLKIGALVLSKKFQTLPGERIGILLPSSSGAYLTILGVLLCGKVPVMLNWTAGVKALDHCVELSEIQSVITSEKFLDRLENADLGKVESLLYRLEEIRQTVTLKDKLCALFLHLFPIKVLLKILHLAHIKASDLAVILFTSGTESLPKGVPLSHANLLSNQRAALKTAPLCSDDLLYGVLPPFHSFGFSVTGLFPILAGLRVCYAPDPTDSHALARDIGAWKPTLFFCAPSFIKALFRVADPKELQSLRLVVSGAEKTPQELFDYVRENLPHAHLLEGYGITECSPVVTLDPLEGPHLGVGRAIFSVELMVIHQETLQPVPTGQEGEICIAGPSVFNGYLGSPREPFLIIDGKRWYRSGDLGHVEKGGALILSGRLKRFIKIGGEMVSLGGLEEELIKLAKEKQWIKVESEGPILAVTALEKDSDKPIIFLFTIFSVSKEEVNVALRNSQQARLVKISDVRVLEQIPLTGTGKTDYRLLEEMSR